MIYQWREIASIPNIPGIYAWYYSPEITDFDLEKVITEVYHFKKNDDYQSAAHSIRAFLDNCLFRYFKEDPYHTAIWGPLKPRYQGVVEHQSGLSEALVQRLIGDPQRLRIIKKVLESSAPDFASPVYIGMSEHLGTRLLRHKSLIEKYKSLSSSEYRSDESIIPERDRRDHSFARQICARDIPPTRLFVVVKILEDIGSAYVDIENILNRIHYPLLGRN